MGRLQSSVGLITGTDIVGTVDQLIAISGQPRDRLVQRTNTLLEEQKAIAELTAAVIGVQLAGSSLTSRSVFRSTAVDSSNPDALSATAGDNADPGTYLVRTLRTAATHAVDSLRRFQSFEESLGLTGSIEIAPDGLIDDSLDLTDLNNGRGVEAGRIRITDRSGAFADIDLTNARTVDDVLEAINDAEIDVYATTVGGAIRLTDQTGQTASNLVVEQLGNAETAADLGLWGIDVASDTATGFELTFDVTSTTSLADLRQGQGIRFADGNDLTLQLSDGSTFNVDFTDFSTPALPDPTIQDVIGLLNQVDPAKFSAAFSGEGIVITDQTGGSGNFAISDAANSTTASDLGLVQSTTGSTITASFVNQPLRGVSLDTLAGGAGLSGLTSLDITLSDGSSATVDVSAATTTSEVLDAINASGLPLIAKLNDARTGYRLRDVSGGSGNFSITSADTTAASLGIEFDGADKIVVGKNVRRQTVDTTTPFSELNQGKGVGGGSLQITDSNGITSGFNITTEGINTVGALIDRINGLGISVTASLNDNGDGIVIVDTGGGAQTLTIEDTGTGTAAADLGIEGEAVTQVVGGATVSAIVGSQSDRIQIDAEDSLADIVAKINSDGRYGDASITQNDDGSYSLRVRSRLGGEAGQIAINTEGFDLGLRTSSRGQDALIAVSSENSVSRFLTSSDGVFDLTELGSSTAGISEKTLLSDLNRGSGVDLRSFTITDSNGVTSAINLRVDEIETVGELVESINSLGIGVTASINEETGGVAVVDTAGGTEELTITDVGNGTAARDLGIAGTATTQTIDGVSVSALVGPAPDDSGLDNTGLVLTVKELSDSPITVTVTEDPEAVTTAANTFVEQFNNLVDKLDSLTFFNSESNEVGLLFGSSEALRIESGYSRLLSGAIMGAGSLRSIGQVGLQFDDKGKLELDSNKLTAALSENSAAVEAFFATDESGLANRLSDLADRIAGETGSLLINRSESLSTQVRRNNERVETLNERLEAERERLLKQFYATEEAIAKIQSNQSYVSQIQPVRIPTN
jgi:flagellar hook-associated protein 2